MRTILKINGVKLNFDVEKYLQAKNIQYNLVGSNAMICCPFHKESHPSFGIHLETGVFRCFNGSCGVRGNLANFVQKIEGFTSYEMTALWLKSRYGINYDDSCDNLELTFGDEKSANKVVHVTEEELKRYDYRHPYLSTRGITDLWQSRFRIGYDREKFAITMPWFDRKDRCVGIKKRSVTNKFFWWENPSEVGPNKITLFGINHVFRRKENKVVIVESEIDALYCWRYGFPAIALGTSSITSEQLNELSNTYVKTVIIATDNDAAGRKIAHDLGTKIDWISDVRSVNWGLYPSKKDVNDLGQVDLMKLIEGAIWKLENKNVS